MLGLMNKFSSPSVSSPFKTPTNRIQPTISHPFKPPRPTFKTPTSNLLEQTLRQMQRESQAQYNRIKSSQMHRIN
jgi:hypothetical protein